MPIDPLLPEIVQSLGQHRVAVLQAPPGAGKTTRVPVALAEAAWIDGRKVLVLEPRRLAATGAARRMAAELGQQVGERVGYRVRLDTKVGAKTQVEVMTDGLFLRRLIQDPDLPGVGCVIFDEFHERGADSDLSLAFLLEVRELCPDLALLVMSATLDPEPIATLMGEATPILRSEGRAFPVDVRYVEPRQYEFLQDTVARSVQDALADTDGDVLVFVPGQAEIRRCEDRLLQELPSDTLVTPLFGDLPLEKQEAAIRAAPSGKRKVVLATAIAESSLTIQGITAVVDSGLARQNVFEPRRGMSHLVTEPASHASAEQRKGRAGRLGPGLCIRLWSEKSDSLRAAMDCPELSRCDMAGVVLSLAAWGTSDASELRLLEPLDLPRLKQGRDLLQRLGALDSANRITPHGQSVASLGAHPRLAHLLLCAKQKGLGTLGARLAVLLGERDPLDRREAGVDLAKRLRWLQGDAMAQSQGTGTGQMRERYHHLAEELGRQAGVDVHRMPLSEQELGLAGELVAMAYPERVALMSSGNNDLLTVMGLHVYLPDRDSLRGFQALAVAEVDFLGSGGSGRVLAAATLPLESLAVLFQDRLTSKHLLTWDDRAKRIEASTEVRLGALVLERKPCNEPDPDDVRALLVQAIRRQQLQPLPWTERARSLQHRLTQLHKHHPAAWPDRSDAWLEQHLEDFLGDHVLGMSSFKQLQSVPLEECLWGDLPYDKRLELERLLPSHWKLPSGREVKIEYGEVPVLAAKLQEFFGCSEHPSVLGGQMPLQIHLLSPAGRPLQVTGDIARFWAGSYLEVRKDGKGRYPKHPWPEDPISAEATALSKKALARRDRQ